MSIIQRIQRARSGSTSRDVVPRRGGHCLANLRREVPHSPTQSRAEKRAKSNQRNDYDSTLLGTGPRRSDKSMHVTARGTAGQACSPWHVSGHPTRRSRAPASHPEERGFSQREGLFPRARTRGGASETACSVAPSRSQPPRTSTSRSLRRCCPRHTTGREARASRRASTPRRVANGRPGTDSSNAPRSPRRRSGRSPNRAPLPLIHSMGPWTLNAPVTSGAGDPLHRRRRRWVACPRQAPTRRARDLGESPALAPHPRHEMRAIPESILSTGSRGPIHRLPYPSPRQLVTALLGRGRVPQQRFPTAHPCRVEAAGPGGTLRQDDSTCAAGTDNKTRGQADGGVDGPPAGRRRPA